MASSKLSSDAFAVLSHCNSAGAYGTGGAGLLIPVMKDHPLIHI